MLHSKRCAEQQQFFVPRLPLSGDFRYCRMHQNGPHGSSPPRPPSVQNIGEGNPRPLYSQQLKIRIQKSERLNRNVLEIQLERDRDSEAVEDEVLEKLIAKIGITKSLIEGVQPVPKRHPNKVYIWFKDPSLDLNQFCKEESYKLGTGVKTGTIRPMDRKEVEVTIKNLNPNTPDSMVLEYLALFGKIVKNVAVYATNREGPFAGLKNGDRKYMIDFSGGRNLGTYHLIDGAKVHISYSGQRRTCARCQRTAGTCPGRGLARSCEQNGGQTVKLGDHMKALWEEIGFKPADFTLENENDENEDTVEIRENEGFTPAHKSRPKMTESCKKNLSGVSIKNLPPEIQAEQVQTFLETKGLPVEHTNISISKMKYSSTVSVEGLTAEVCNSIMANIEGTTAFEKKIYCKGIVDDLETENIDDIHQKSEAEDLSDKTEELNEATSVTPTKPEINKISQQGPKIDPKVDIPGLNLSKNQEKKLKQLKKKKDDEKEDEDHVWQSLKTHPVFKAQKGANKDDNDKKRNAVTADLSPQDKSLTNRGKNPKTT